MQSMGLGQYPLASGTINEQYEARVEKPTGPLIVAATTIYYGIIRGISSGGGALNALSTLGSSYGKTVLAFTRVG
jgi:hypothetical protein